MIYNVVLVSAIQQSDSLKHICLHFIYEKNESKVKKKHAEVPQLTHYAWISRKLMLVMKTANHVQNFWRELSHEEEIFKRWQKKKKKNSICLEKIKLCKYFSL